MSQQKIIWTALPFGRVEEGPLKGRLRVSVVASPRLTPEQPGEQTLAAYPDLRDWPRTVEALTFTLDVDGTTLPLEALPAPDLAPWTRPKLWDTLLPPSTPVAGFVFKDMSRVNLRSFSVRNVLGFARKHYGDLAQQPGDEHPTLLPWRQADPALKGLLGSLGTSTLLQNFGRMQLELPNPKRFDRFFDDADKEGVEARVSSLVFGPQSIHQLPVAGLDGQTSGSAPVRAMPSDWQDPALNSAHQALMSQFQTADEYTLYQANRFYRRQPATAADLARRRPDLQGMAPPLKPPEFDFHQIIASLADHPDLMRALGLVLDFVLPEHNPIDAALNAQSQHDGTLGLSVQWGVPHPPPASDPDGHPRTAYRASKARFVTRARTADHADGLLHLAGTTDPTLPHAPTTVARLERGLFDVYQVDPDGAALKTADFLVTAQNLVARHLAMGTDGQVTYTTGDKQPVAALRSGGLGVLRHGRAAHVAITAAATALKNQTIEHTPTQAKAIVLFTEDVLRGYRVDARHDRWRSLCWREGRYQLIQQADTPVPIAPDEGYVKSASTTGDGGDDHYLHETLFRWTGWSLVAPRPGLSIQAEAASDSGLQGEQVGTVDAQAERGNGLAVRFKARKGTLPRLRFGLDYRFRARIVDLAGNSLQADDPDLGDLEQATEPVAYLRFEPIDPPALVHRHRVSEGESLERMVIRSNFNADTTAYLSTPDFAAETAKPASADFAYQALNERHVVPPKSAQLQCEQHGLFDAELDQGTPEAIKQAYATAAREAGTLLDSTPGAQLELVTPSSVKDVATSTTLPLHMPKADKPTGDRLVGGQYIVHHEALIETPYLPDGAAAGVSIRAEAGHALPGITPAVTLPLVLGPGAAVVMGPQQQPVLLVSHGKQWPDSQGLRLVLAERTATLDDGPCSEAFADDSLPKWDAATRTLTLFLPKGRIARLRYASFVHPHFAGHLGIPQWTDTAGQRNAVLQSAMLGLHWMVTPFRSIVLVHATQQPVCAPKLQKLTARREAGSHTADLNGWVQLHGPSSGKFEVQAQWHEWHDDPSRERPERIALRGQLGEIPLSENHANQFDLAGAAAANTPTSPNPNNPAAPVRSLGNRQDFGDTRFRLVTYHLVATTRFREYLPPSLFEQLDKVTRVGPPTLETSALLGSDADLGAPVLFNVTGATPNGTIVPNTAPPASPQVVYVVPTFQWQQALGAQLPTQSSTRFGNGLRVYLDRPWFSSGDGELLGVVLLPDGTPFQGMPDALQPYVTQWGLDPLFDAAHPSPAIRAQDFARAVRSDNVALVELQTAADTAAAKATQSVTVVGHRVQWDDSRKLWFADIELNPGLSYMPFVRLALVRYQPHSLMFAKVSRVVQAEFAQVLPRRSAELSVQNGRVSVSLHGPVPDHGPMRFHLPSDSDGPFANVSIVPPLGSVLESGRNRIELVLQTRDPAIDSDLAWHDAGTLSTSLAVPPGGKTDTNGPVIFQSPAVPLSETQTMRTGRLGAAISFDTQVLRTMPSIPLPPGLFDPIIWQASAVVPDVGGKPARLVLREFERYHTDRTVPEQHGSSQWRRRVVEERLVYTEFFPLN